MFQLLPESLKIGLSCLHLDGIHNNGSDGRSHKRRWSIVSLLFTASLINYLDRAAISFALPLISRDFHLTAQTKGLLLSSFFWSYALMQIPIGWCADRFNLRWLYAGAFTLWSLAQGLTGLASSLTALLASGSSRRRRIHLPPGRDKNRKLVVYAETTRSPFRTFRLRDSDRIGPRRHHGSLALGASGWRHTFLLLGFTALVWIAHGSGFSLAACER